MRDPSTGSLARIADAFRLALFVRVAETRLVPTWGEVVAAALLTVFVPTAFTFAMLMGEGAWSLETLPHALLLVPVALVASTFAAWLARRSDAVPVVLFATLLAWLAIDTLSLSAWAILGVVEAERALDWSSALFFGPLAWLALAMARFTATLAPPGAGRRVALALAFALLLAAPLALLQPERSLWLRDWSRAGENAAAAAARRTVASEQAILGQRTLLDAQLAALTPGRRGVIDVYFVGMAGYGPQDVFMREVDAVASLMRERFDADGRVVKLVNNPKTVRATPIASLTTLRATLATVAARMDRDEDVLVLFLTSHGTADHQFMLDLWPLAFDPVDPSALARALDESGIRNRVVVVSACYSGGFVQRLAGEDTLVITAAAPDRNSFGCSNEAEWTYFGRAFFDEALRRTRSFTRAFEIAAPLVESRERAQGFEPSRPQIAGGAAIRERLAALERQLEAAVVARAERAASRMQ